MRKFAKSHHSSLNELNITPLLDLAFVLLVIFIITTPQLMNNLELNLPSSRPLPPATNTPRPKVNTIVVKADGKVTFNDAAASLDQLRLWLDQMRKEEPEAGVVVRGSSQVDYQNVVNVLDIISQLNITKLGIATETID